MDQTSCIHTWMGDCPLVYNKFARKGRGRPSMGMACHPARPASRLGAEEAPPWLYTGNRKKAALSRTGNSFSRGLAISRFHLPEGRTSSSALPGRGRISLAAGLGAQPCADRAEGKCCQTSRFSFRRRDPRPDADAGGGSTSVRPEVSYITLAWLTLITSCERSFPVCLSTHLRITLPLR